jgi:hypothetical protein
MSAAGRRLGRWSSASQDEFEAELVVRLALLGIGKDFVGLRALLEFLGRFGVILVLVGVEFQGRLPREGTTRLVKQVL